MTRRLDQAQVITRGKLARGVVRGRPAWAAGGGGGVTPQVLAWESGYLTGGSSDEAVIEFDDVQEGDLIVVATTERWGPYTPAGFTLVADQGGTYSAGVSFKKEGPDPTGVYTIEGSGNNRGYIIVHSRGAKLHTLNRPRAGVSVGTEPRVLGAVDDIASDTPTFGLAMCKEFSSSSPSEALWTFPSDYSYLYLGGPASTRLHNSTVVVALDDPADPPSQIEYSRGTNGGLVQALLVPTDHIGPRDQRLVGLTTLPFASNLSSVQMPLHSSSKVDDTAVVLYSHGNNNGTGPNVVDGTLVDTVTVSGSNYTASVTVWTKVLTETDIANGYLTVEGTTGTARSKHVQVAVFDGAVTVHGVQEEAVTVDGGDPTIWYGPTVTSPPDNATMLAVFEASHFGQGRPWTFDAYYDNVAQAFTGSTWWRDTRFLLKRDVGTGGVPVTVNGSASTVVASGTQPKVVTVLVT